jgi:hypothetical protein
MIGCPGCAHKNLQGTYFCEECGLALVSGSSVLLTRKVSTRSPSVAPSDPQWGTESQDKVVGLQLHVMGIGNTITLDRGFGSATLGRKDPANNVQPDIDLEPFGGLEKGVSRHHATITHIEDTLVIQDNGSSNGTYVNDQRLVPHQPRVIRNGDVIRFGLLATSIRFEL